MDRWPGLDRDKMPSDRNGENNSAQTPESDEDGWLLDGLAIRPPLEEFRRLFEMKKRAFEGKVDADSLRKYEMARRLGEQFISDESYDQGSQQGGDPC